MAKDKQVRFSDQLRGLIESSGKSRYAISKETGIDEATLSRFMSGKGGLSIEGLDALAANLGLTITRTKAKGT
jgi:transcriptional regulator with XRE-family HTH domain